VAKLVIFGAGDIAKLAYYYFLNDSSHQVKGFAVDKQYRKAEKFLGLPLIDFDRAPELFPPKDFMMFIALSYAKMNKVRAEKYFRAKEMGYQLASYVSSRCTYLAEKPPGDNCFILEDNTIQPFVEIGNNVTLWSGNHIGHEAVIEDHCFISSHVVVSGHVRVGSYSFLGVNSTLRNGIKIAPRTLVGAGAVIMQDTEEGGVYVPGRSIKLNKTSDEVEL